MDDFEGLIKLGEEHLVTSEILFESEQYKFSIAHVYYAMFSVAKALLIKIGYTTKTHDGLISAFSNEYVNKRDFSKSCFKYLTSARTMRTKASYDYSINYNKQDAENKINECYLFLDESKKYY